ncbi:Lrp/AsnC family transcriptional regulator [Sphaerisporangium rufum]|nr:Lrp/AsnC family transcriptional regulator [Sphaerisporangium rufum]
MPTDQVTLDATDWAIIEELQRDARLPLTELGRRINLSASATTERLRRLEAAGVVTGYHAFIDPAKVGLPVLAVIRLKFPGSRHERLHDLLAQRREIIECLRVTGDDCYVIRAAASSMAHLERVVDELAALGSTTTSVVYGAPMPYRGVCGP